MLQHAHALRILMAGLASFFLWGCASLNPTMPESLATYVLIETLRHERIETLYYEKYPQNVKELMVRQGIVAPLVRAFHHGGDDLYRFNVIVVLNHRAALSDSEKLTIVQCLEQALADSFAWVRTEAVWGIGLLGSRRSVPRVVPLLDDPDSKVVNETVLTLARLAGMPNTPISNENMSAEERRKLVEFWKDWWDRVGSKSSL